MLELPSCVVGIVFRIAETDAEAGMRQTVGWRKGLEVQFQLACSRQTELTQPLTTMRTVLSHSHLPGWRPRRLTPQATMKSMPDSICQLNSATRSAEIIDGSIRRKGMFDYSTAACGFRDYIKFITKERAGSLCHATPVAACRRVSRPAQYMAECRQRRQSALQQTDRPLVRRRFFHRR